MGGRMLTRREAIGIGVASFASFAGAVGCNEKDVENAAGDAVIAIGGVVLALPVPLVGQVIGVVLVVGGSALKIYIACQDGSQEDREIQLTEEQERTIGKARDAGEQFTVRGANGKKRRVEDFTGKNSYIQAFEEARRR